MRGSKPFGATRARGVRGCVLALVPALAACGSGSTQDAAVQDAGAGDTFAPDAPSADDVADAPPPPEDGGAVTGTVVDLTTDRPLAGRSVFVEGRSAVTDSAGQFTIPEAASVYDAVVIDADGSIVTAYLGLRRRDPILVHRTSGVTDPSQVTATVTGSLSGDGEFPLGPNDGVGVYAFSAQGDGRALLSGSGPDAMLGPAYGPMLIAWDGASPFDGQLVGLGSFGSADAGFTWAYARQSISVAAGQTATVNVALAAVPEVTLSGAVQAPPGYGILEKQVYYHFPIVHAVLPVTLDESTLAAFAYSVPDLGDQGASLCVEAVGSPGTLITQQCSLSASQPASVTLEAAPSLSPPLGTSLSAGSSLTWSAFDDGIYLLRLESSPPTQETPDVDVFTASPSLSLPDIQALGVPFPVGLEYAFTLVGVGPFASMDDAFGPTGVGDPLPAEQRWSYSPSADVALTP